MSAEILTSSSEAKTPSPKKYHDGSDAALLVTVRPPSIGSLRHLVHAEHGGIAPEDNHDGASVNLLGNEIQGSSLGSDSLLGARLARTGTIGRHA